MSNNKKINFFSGVIMPIAVAVTTIVLFFLFKPIETESLFYINLCYTVFLEAVFFGYINVLHTKTKDLSKAFFAIMGIYCLYYVIASFVWILLYSLLLSHFTTVKLYVAVIIILTILWIIVSSLTAQTDSNFKQKTDALKDAGQSLNFYKQKIILLSSRYEKLCAEKGLKYETDSSNRTVLDRLTGKISFLTPNVLRNETAVAQLTALLNKCESLIDETESAPETTVAEVQKKMQRFVDNAVAELDMLKNLTRG